MSPFSAFKRFFNSDVHGYVPMDDAFVQIDRDKIIEKLRLIERGKEQGELNLPSADEVKLDVVEKDIISEISQALNAAQIDARNQSQAYENRLSDLQLLHEVGTILSATRKATGDFDTLVIDWKNRLSNRRDSIVQSYHDLQSFRTDNGINRPVFQTPAQVVTYSSIAFAGLAEVAGNAVFLRVNDDLGYLGGLIAAIMIAVVNIGLAGVVGYFVWPKTNLKSLAARLFSWAGIAVWLAIVATWNLLAAHYRDAKSLGANDPQSEALTLLSTTPFGLDGIYSWGLLIIGIIAALVAARATYKMEDPFPGYGERGRQHSDRCEDYADEVAKANRELTGVRDDAITDAEEVKGQLGLQFRERNRIQSAFNRFAERYQQYQLQLEQTANYLLQAYRNANRQSRTEPDPPYFSEDHELAMSKLELLYNETVRKEDIEAAENALTECIHEIDEAFRKSIAQFEPLDKLREELKSGKV